MFDNFYGVKIVELGVKEYRQYKTHRKPRINKKWRKRYGVYPVYYDDDTAYVIGVPGQGKVLYCTHKVAMLIKQEMRYERL
jgi:hypothetical protein